MTLQHRSQNSETDEKQFSRRKERWHETASDGHKVAQLTKTDAKRGSQRRAGLRVESANEFIRAIFRSYFLLKLIYLNLTKTLEGKNKIQVFSDKKNSKLRNPKMNTFLSYKNLADDKVISWFLVQNRFMWFSVHLHHAFYAFAVWTWLTSYFRGLRTNITFVTCCAFAEGRSLRTLARGRMNLLQMSINWRILQEKYWNLSMKMWKMNLSSGKIHYFIISNKKWKLCNFSLEVCSVLWGKLIFMHLI